MGDQVFVSECYGSGGVLLDIAPDLTAKPAWINPTFGTHFMNAIPKDGYLYGIDGHGPTDATGGTEEAWRRVGTIGSGGPQIAVALEHAADEFLLVKVAGDGSGSGKEDSSDAVGATQNADRGKSSRRVRRSSKATDSRSPYEVFRSRGTLSVSDLVGPAWYV